MDIIVVGGGASGLFFSLNASKKGHNVTVIERNEKVGKKLFISGKGRCNVTSDSDNKTIMGNVVTNSKFLYSALNKWSCADTINFFNSHGCPLVTERGNRVFPQSGKSLDIIRTLHNECLKEGVIFIYKERVVSAYKNNENDKFVIRTQSGRIFKSDALVIATGGKSYAATGSSGDGYSLASSFSHNIISPVGALVPIKVKEKIPSSLINLTLKNVTLKASGTKFEYKEFGDLEFLPSRLTGPISLTISSLINRKEHVNLELDLKPALSEDQLVNRILREVKDKKNNTVFDLLKTLLPLSFISLFLSKCNVEEYKSLDVLLREDRDKIIFYLKHFPFTYDGLDNIDHAIVTSGGVDVKEINPSTMESKLVEKLFFVGEVIDIDALTGGFNIQLAFSTGYLASEAL
ncbi:MAG: NAD(P)/FAD-dependent oxidoreductase [Bacilli bacterium]